MAKSRASYRVKVLVDGRWVSTGDFYVLDQARERARLIASHLNRPVEIRDAQGELIHREDFLREKVPRAVDSSEDDASRKTVLLD